MAETLYGPLMFAATGPALVSVPRDAVANLHLDHWQQPPTQALIAPIVSAQGGSPLGFLVAGLNPHRAANADYQGFVELLAGQVSAAIVRSDDYRAGAGASGSFGRNRPRQDGLFLQR